MNIALVIAGGSGTRTGQDVPKQFLNVHDVPIFIYTLDNLENTDCIDGIVVVGPSGWEDYILSYSKQFGIKKMKGVVIGGNTRSNSIINGLNYIKELDEHKQIIVSIIDANRPLTPQYVIKAGLDMLNECDCSVAVVPCFDSMFRSADGITLDENDDRSVLYAGQTPNTTRLKDALIIYALAERDQLLDLPTPALFLHYGKKVKAVEGSRKSMKITTLEDFELFRALLGEKRLTCLKQCD